MSLSQFSNKVNVIEARQVNNDKMAGAVRLHWLYSTIFLTAYGRIPTGVMGLASLGIGLSVREVREML